MKFSVRSVLHSNGLLYFFLIFPVIMEAFTQTFYPYYLMPLFTAALLLMAVLRGRKPSALGVIFLLYALWMAVSRLLLGQWQDFLNPEADFQPTVLRPVLGACLVLLAGSLAGEDRRKFLNRLTLAFCGFMTLLGLAAIFTSITLHPLFIRGIYLSWIETDDKVIYPKLLGVHRNICGACFMAAFFLLIRRFLNCENRRGCILIGLSLPVVFFGIALQHSRTACVATACGLGMLALALVMERFGGKINGRRLASAAAAVLLTVAVGYKALDFCADLTGAASRIVRGMLGKQVIQLSDTDEPASDTVYIEDSREFMNDLGSFTGRTDIWKTAWKVSTRSAGSLLLGNPESHFPEDLQQIGGFTRRVIHGHNLFVQALYVSGVPGVLMLLAFVLCLLKYMLIRFFRQELRAREKCLVILLACLLIYGLLEPLLSAATAMVSDIFLLSAGILEAEEKEQPRIQ